jgi:protein-tyrosine phosphatase
MVKILMVCLGNICRSPMAEGIMREKLKESQIKGMVDSCGTASYHVGDDPDRRAQSCLMNHNIDIHSLRGRQFDISDFDKFDYIFTMDENNYRDIKSLCRSERDEAKVSMIMNEVYPNQNKAVPDPYYGGIEGFEYTYELLDLACEKIAKRLKN